MFSKARGPGRVVGYSEVVPSNFRPPLLGRPRYKSLHINCSARSPVRKWSLSTELAQRCAPAAWALVARRLCLLTARAPVAMFESRMLDLDALRLAIRFRPVSPVSGWLEFLRFGVTANGFLRCLRRRRHAGVLQDSGCLFRRGGEHQLAQVTNRGLLIGHQISQVAGRLGHALHLAIIFRPQGGAGALHQLM